MNTFLISNKWQYRLGRTVLQAIVGFFVANVDVIIEALNFDGTTKAIIVGIVMCILSPLMKKLGVEDEKHRDETYNRPVPEEDDEC